MQKEHIRHLAIAGIINALFVAFLVYKATGPSDKDVISVVIGIPFLITVNGLTWLILRLLKNSHFRLYRIITIGLVISILPIFSILSNY